MMCASVRSTAGSEPRQGPPNMAHGVSRGLAGPSSPPPPLPHATVEDPGDGNDGGGGPCRHVLQKPAARDTLLGHDKPPVGKG